MTEHNKSYTADDVDILNERDHVRLRTPMFLGDVNKTQYSILNLAGTSLEPEDIEFVPAVYKAIGEIIDNSLDEFAQIKISSKLLTITADPTVGRYTIMDNGRGIPIQKKKVQNHLHKVEEKWVPELLLGNLRSGRNFRDTADKSVGVIGMNGVGAGVTNFCSTEFSVSIQRDKQSYVQQFTDGASKIGKPVITAITSTKTGTTISFELDPTVFKNGVSLPIKLLQNRAIEIAATNPGLTVQYNDKNIKFKNGMQDVVTTLSNGKGFGIFRISTPDTTGEIFVIPNSHSNVDERIFTWINSSYLFDGGKCNTQFLNAFMDKAIDAVEKKGAKSKISVTKNDVRFGVTVIANLKLKNPSYDSQAKTRLSGPDLRKDMVASVEAEWKGFAKQFDGWLEDCVIRAAVRQNKAATSSMDDETKKKGKIKVPGLLDATSKIRADCMLFVVEGECLSENTDIRVLSDKGMVDVPMKDIEVGDLVITHLGKFRPVTNKTTSIKPGVEIKLGDGTVLVSSPNHKWLAYDDRVDAFDWVKTKDLLLSHKLIRSKLGGFCGGDAFTISANQEDDRLKYPYIINTLTTNMKSSAEHGWIVLNTDDMEISEIKCCDLNPEIHLLALHAISPKPCIKKI